jgi:putative transposase
MHLPHLRSFEKAPIVFLTVCTYQRQARLADPVAHEILTDLWGRSAELNGWYVGHYVLMPDHLHLFAAPGFDAQPLAGWMRLWKSISSTRINRRNGQEGSFWQADYFDRYLRSLDDYTQKWDYVALNPLRKGLVDEPSVWPYRGTIHDLRIRTMRG